MVKEYQTEKDYLVLSMVKKYPTYSLDRLMETLPGISRHSLQTLLEKNDLSTIEKRLAFAQQKKPFLLTLGKIFQGVPFFFKNHGRIVGAEMGKFRPEFFLNWKRARNLVLALVVVFLLFRVGNYYLAQPPEIKLDSPAVDWTNRGEKLFVIGQVTPKNSQVLVNNQLVAINGDGSFTAITKIPLGESVLKIEAKRASKTASLLRLVNREPTDEEVEAQKKEAEKKAKAMVDQAAELDRTVNDLLAAKNAGTGQGEFLRIVNNHVQESAGFTSVVGEVVNLTKEGATWVMITAKFYDQAGTLVDTKYGFATDFDQVLGPGKRASFETQATRKKFDYYSLELSFEKERVAGVSTEATLEGQLATISGQPR